MEWVGTGAGWVVVKREVERTIRTGTLLKVRLVDAEALGLQKDVFGESLAARGAIPEEGMIQASLWLSFEGDEWHSVWFWQPRDQPAVFL